MARSLFLLGVFLIGSVVLAISARLILDDENRKLLLAGQELLASGKSEEAATALEKVGGDPVREDIATEARLLRVRALIVAGKHEAGAEVARAFYELLPLDHPARGRAHVLIAEAFEASGKMLEASKILGEEARLVLSEGHRGRVAGYYFALAQAHEKETPPRNALSAPTPANPVLAAELYSRGLTVLTNGKPLARITLPLARNLLLAGDPATAAGALSRLLELEGLNERVVAEARLLRAKALMQSGDFVGARHELERLLKLPSLDETAEGPAGLLLLGDVHLAQSGSIGRVQDAVATWKQWLEKFPTREEVPSVKERIAAAFVTNGLFDAAIPALEALANESKATVSIRANALFEIGVALQNLQRFDDARAALKRYIASYPDHDDVPTAQELLPDLLLQKAHFRRAEKDDDGAVAAYREFLAESPQSEKAPLIAVEVALVLRAQKKLADAEQAAVAARDRYRTHHPDAASQAAFLLAKLAEEDEKNLEKAIARYREVASGFGGTSGAQQAGLRIAQMEDVTLALSVPRLFAPGDDVALDLEVRNISKAQVRIYSLNAREYFERRGTLDGAADIEVALVKSDRNFTYEVPDYRRYQKLKSSLKVELLGGKALPAGSYLVAIEAEERRSVVMVIVSDVRVVVKESPLEVFAWAIDAKSGEPREGVELLVRGANVAKTITTDKDGVARLAHESAKGRCEVLAISGASVAPGMAKDPAPPATEVLTPRAAFTLDRPIYRPGSEVRFRAVLRSVQRGAFVTPEEKEVSLTLQDPSGRHLQSQVLPVGAFGIVHGSFFLGSEASVGDYNLLLHFASQNFNERVVVAAYKKPEYSVTVAPKQRTARPGEEVEVDVAVAYFFGGAVQHASFEWSVWRSPHAIDTTRYLSHAWYLHATKAEKKDLNPTSGAVFVANGAGSIGEKGTGSFVFRATEDTHSQRYFIQVAVKDTGGQWVTGSGATFTGLIDRYAVVLSERKTARAGTPVEVRVITADLGQRNTAMKGVLKALAERRAPDGKQTLDIEAEHTIETGLEGEARVKLELPKAGSYLLRFEGEDSRKAPVVAETRLTITGERPNLSNEAELRFEKEVYRGGEVANAHLSLPEAGRPVLMTFEGEGVLKHRILRPKKTSETHEIELSEAFAPNIVVAISAPTAEKIYVAEDRVIILRYLAVKAKPSKAEALPGDEVEIEVTTEDQLGRPVEAAVALRATDGALLDLGGSFGEDPRYVFNRDVRPHLVRTGSSFAFRFDGKTTFLDPDLLALENEKKQRTQQEGAKELHKAEAARAPGAPVGPGSGGDSSAKASHSIRPTAKAGAAPAEKKDGDFRFGGRSGGSKNLRARGGGGGGGTAPSPSPKPGEPGKSEGADAFDGASDEEGVLLDSLVVEGIERGTRMGATAYGLSTVAHSVEAAPFPLIEPTLREAFLDVAGWWPDLITDKSGKSSVKLKLPDNLTTWDLGAAGADRGISVGQGQASLRVKKDVLVRLERPRFLTSQDESALAVVVHSSLDQALDLEEDFRVLESGLLDAVGMSEASYVLPALGKHRSDYRVKSKSSGVAILEAKARSTVASDAVRLGLPILAFGEPWVHARSESLIDRAHFECEIPAAVVPGSENYTVIVQGGMMADLLAGLNFLGTYPYGCFEQTVHRFLPAMVLSETLRSLGRPTRLDQNALQAEVARSLANLAALQNPDGGFGYWPKAASDPYATAMALDALVQMKQFHYATDATLLAFTINGARQLLSGQGVELDARAALIHALASAGTIDEAALNSLHRERGGLSTPGLCRLILASSAALRKSWLPGLFAELKQRRRPKAEIAPFEGRGPGCWHGSTLEATALALLAYEAVDAPETEIGPLVAAVRRGLLQREGSTKAVAAAVLALVSHVKKEGAIQSQGSVEVLVDGTSVAKGEISELDPVLGLSIPVGKLPPGKHQIDVRKSGGDPATCRVVFRSVRSMDTVEAAGNVFSVMRRVVPFQDPDQPRSDVAAGYSIVKPEKRPRAPEPRRLREASVATKVTIELRVRAEADTAYLVLDDPQFAGFEVIASGVRGAFDRFERRESSLLFFKNRLAKGEEMVVTYPCYVVHEGQFHALSARVEEMYAPERFGRSASDKFKIVRDAALLASVAPPEKTPDELFTAGQQAFAKGRYEEAVNALAGLPKAFDLVDDVHDAVLKTLLLSNLRLERFTESVKLQSQIQERRPASDDFEAEDRERLGQAYLHVGDGHAARVPFQRLLAEALAREVAVATTYRELGDRAEAVSHLTKALWRYPVPGDGLSRLAELASWQRELPDSTLGAEAEKLPALHRTRWRDAMATWMSLLAWEPKSGLAAEAGFERVIMYQRLGFHEAVVSEAGRFLTRHKNSERRDDVVFARADAAFRLGKHEDAAKDAETLWTERWHLNKGLDAPSEFRFEAGYLLGRIAHVKGEYEKAVKWYGDVRAHVPDAQQSWKFFTMKELKLEPIVRASSEQEVKLGFDAKNLDTAKIQIYPVDLSVLFAVKKSFEKLNTAELSGITPSMEKEVKLGLKPWALGRSEVSLGKLGKGAYLVVVRSGDQAASTLLLVTTTSLTIQRTDGAIRLYLVDEEGRPVADARVKIGLGGRIFHSGETDERGMLAVADPGKGLITVVAEKGAAVAVAQHP